MALYNLAGFKTTTLGTADVVFNAPVTALNTFPLAGVPNGSTVTYMLENFDGAGSVDAREVGRGVWNSGTLTLARTTVVDSTNGGAKIVLGGTAEARITAIAQDFSAAEVGAPALVAPSVAGNFVSFSNVSGGQADSGFSGASFQPIDATLTSIAALGSAADKMIYTTALNTWAEADLSAFARTFLDDANAAAVRTTIGAGTGSGDISGTGVVGQVAEFVTNTKTIQAAKIIGPVTNILTITNSAASTLALAITSAKTLTLTAVDNWNLTVPATGTAALGSAVAPGTSPGGGPLYYAALWNTANTLSYDTNVGYGTYFGVISFFAPSLTISGTVINFTNSGSGIFNATAGNMFFRAIASKNINFGDNAAAAITIGAGGGRVTIGVPSGTAPATGVLGFYKSTTTTNAVLEVALIRAEVSTASTGSANGFGASLGIYAETATNNTEQIQALIAASWIDATNASRKAKMSLSAYDTAARLGIEIEASGTAVKLGFFGVATVIQPASANQAALTNSTTGTYNGTLVDVGVVFSQAAINDNFTDVHTLLNEIRTALVNTGIIKGAA